MTGPLRARSEGLVVEELGDELLVYDLDTDAVHCLTPIAARVWRACDGTASTVALAQELGLSADELTGALAELDRCDLLVSPAIEVGVENGGLSRRDLGLKVTKVAAATATVPLILSIAAPAAAQTQTQIEFCLAIPITKGCGDCNQGGSETPCCCCQKVGGKSGEQQCSPDEAFCIKPVAQGGLGGSNCTESVNA
jgi:hypothetical protein